MKTLKLIDIVGPNPILHSWGYADAYIRQPDKKYPSPSAKVFYDKNRGLYLPLQFAITFINKSGAGSTTAGNMSGVAIMDTTGLNFLVAAIADYSSVGASTISDNKGNASWQYLTASIQTSLRIRIAYHVNAAGGTSHAFSTTNAGTSYPAIAVLALAGLDTSSPYDTTTGESSATVASGATITLGSLTPSVANEVVIAAEAANVDTSNTINQSFMSPVQSGGANAGTSFYAGISYLIQTSAAAQNPTFTGTDTTNGRCARMACFKSSGGAAAVIHTLGALGVGN